MSSANIEKKALKLGYMPLSDCLPLLIAQSQGFFKDEQLDVELQQEVSWANIRDKVIVGQLDGAHMLAPMIIASSLGLGGLKKGLMTAYSFALNGNAFTVSNALYDELADIDPQQTDQAATFKSLLSKRKTEGRNAPVIATVYPYSCHSLQLRYWLASAGINPDLDIQLVVLPPSQMVDHLRLKHIDGFFAGAPWNSVAIQNDLGRCLLTSPEIWQSAPEKVFGTTQDWHEKHPNTHAAIIRALYKAGAWIEAHKEESIRLLADTLSTSSAWIDDNSLSPAITGDFVYEKGSGPRRVENMLVFHHSLANFPWLSHASWMIKQMQHWQFIPEDIDHDQLVTQCYRPDIYRSALQGIAPLPAQNFKSEGANAQNWHIETNQGAILMYSDAFIDNHKFAYSL